MSDFMDGFDLASLRLGGAVVASSDDYFAEKENLLKPGPAVWLEHEYTDKGKWMDGWESRRKRTPGHDWAIIRLGVPGVLRGALVDTSFFRGNYPDSCSIEACAERSDAPLDRLLSPDAEWVEVLPRSPLAGDSKNAFSIESPYAFSWVRLNIFPDGGVARLRLYGDVVPDWRLRGHARGEIDLAAAEHGGDVLLASDMFFGERRNLVMPGRAVNMSDGWETRRRRGPGHDWAIVKLGAPGTITRVELDTNHFKGNFPDTCTLEASASSSVKDATFAELLPRTKLQAHTRHFFEDELAQLGPVSLVRLAVYPDGGVSRLRLFGTLSDDARRGLGVRRLDTLPPRRARAELVACCSAPKWLDAVLAARPYGDAARLFSVSDEAWAATGPEDWLAAFQSHPRIGERTSARSWSAREQAGMDAANDELRRRMAELNQQYEERFGFTYIVCATGKTADELSSILESRLNNDRDAELRTAARELHAITRLRLAKLLEP
ncbi:MAG: allantoicase [Polyangiaceae bacterium]|jgi:allantoicase|nr:allantoicase [Polyangiaceae bacterium]MBK8936987.1 allantoicase [Polyangiaceae bacterium]